VTPVDTTAVVDLLGVLAYAELTAFDRLAEDARLAPTLGGKAALAKMAAAEIGHHVRLAERLTELGVDPAEAMAPFVPALDTFHESTRPKTWLEGLVKAYVGDGLATDFYREIASFLPDPDQALTPGTPTSPSARCGRPSPPTGRWPAGWRCGDGAWSARP
jgi:hypothetical protein